MKDKTQRDGSPLFILSFSLKDKMKRDDQALSISSMKDKMERARSALSNPCSSCLRQDEKGRSRPFHLVYEREEEKGRVVPFRLIHMKDKMKRDEKTRRKGTIQPFPSCPSRSALSTPFSSCLRQDKKGRVPPLFILSMKDKPKREGPPPFHLFYERQDEKGRLSPFHLVYERQDGERARSALSTPLFISS